METVYPACAALDFRKEGVLACVRRLIDGKAQEEMRTFRPEPNQILALSDWLIEGEVTHVALEPAGPDWEVVWKLFEGAFELLLVNAEHIKQVPGRKVGVEDSQWIAELLQHGLLSPGFLPERPPAELRDLTRDRAELTRRKVQKAGRIRELFKDVNVGWARQASDLQGAAGRERIRTMLRAGKAPAGGPEAGPPGNGPDSSVAPSAEITSHRRFLVGMLLDEMDFLDKQIERMSQRIADVLPATSVTHARRLGRVSGNDRPAAEESVAEMHSRQHPGPSPGGGAGAGPVAGGVPGTDIPGDPARRAEGPGGSSPPLSTPTGQPGPPAEGLENARSGKRRGRRVRVVTDEDKYRLHRWKKRLRILLKLLLWPLALAIMVVLLWLILDRMMKPPPE